MCTLLLALGYGKPAAGVAVALRAPERAGDGEAVAVAVVVKNVSGRRLSLRAVYEVLVTYPVPGERGCARAASVTRRIALEPPPETTLAAGDVWVEAADLQAAAQQSGGRLPAGFYKLQASVYPAEGTWAASSERARLVIAGKVPPDRCATNPGWEAF